MSTFKNVFLKTDLMWIAVVIMSMGISFWVFIGVGLCFMANQVQNELFREAEDQEDLEKLAVARSSTPSEMAVELKDGDILEEDWKL